MNDFFLTKFSKSQLMIVEQSDEQTWSKNFLCYEFFFLS